MSKVRYLESPDFLIERITTFQKINLLPFTYHVSVNATAFAFRSSICVAPCRYKMCCHLTFSRKHLFLEVLLMDEFLS